MILINDTWIDLDKVFIIEKHTTESPIQGKIFHKIRFHYKPPKILNESGDYYDMYFKNEEERDEAFLDISVYDRRKLNNGSIKHTITDGG